MHSGPAVAVVPGALLMDLAYIAALFASVRAFHYPVTFAVAGAVYLTGTVVASCRSQPLEGRSGEPP